MSSSRLGGHSEVVSEEVARVSLVSKVSMINSGRAAAKVEQELIPLEIYSRNSRKCSVAEDKEVPQDELNSKRKVKT